MKIRLDRTVCDGFGTCAARAPGYFSLDDWGYASLTTPAQAPPPNVPAANVPAADGPPANVTLRSVAPGNVAPEDELAVHRAILDCPVHAITILRE
jgi:ferredoxin